MSEKTIKAMLEYAAYGWEVSEATLRELVKDVLKDDPYMRKRVSGFESDNVLNLTVTVRAVVNPDLAKDVLKEMCK